MDPKETPVRFESRFFEVWKLRKVKGPGKNLLLT